MEPEVVAVGHAIVDVLAHVTDELVSELGLTKGTMTLVDGKQAELIYSAIGPATMASGGSAANTAAGLASLGARVSFAGKVADDELGRFFSKDMAAAGVAFDVPFAEEGPPTGRSIVLVTPDGEKTMCTNLGVGDLLLPSDLDAGSISAAKVAYVEGYLCGLPHTDATVEAVLSAAESGGTLVALSLSDPLWVELHASELDELLDRVDLLFANEQEALGMTGSGTVAGAVGALSRRCRTVVVTRGAKGSLVAAGGEVVEVPAEPVARVVDTTGAGDQFAAGFIYGTLRGLDPAASARLGALAAGEVVGHLGARPRVSLSTLLGS